MNGLAGLFSEPWMQRLGWVLIHFIWQGTGIALLLAAVLRLLTRASSHIRYTVIAGALLICALMPAATWTMLGPQAPLPASPAVISSLADIPQVDAPFMPGSSNADMNATPGSPVTAKIRWQENLNRLANTALPYVVCLWFGGVLILTFRLTLGWTLMQRLRRSGRPILDSSCVERFQRLIDRMQVRVPVRLLESALVEVPTLIGWLRPTILVPASVLIGLTPDQLDAILAHELAHVRRYDYLVNLFQTVIETVLFYHPAIWWISRKLREERENCCDDIALEVMQDRLVYVSALAQLEQGRALPLAMTASGGSLLQRIRRIAGESASRPAMGWPVLLAVISLLIALAAAPFVKAQNNQLLAAPTTVTEAEAKQKGIAALVNGKPIYWSDVNYDYPSHEPSLEAKFSGDALKEKMAELRMARAEGYIDRELAVQSAEALGYQTPQSLLDERVEFGVKGFGGDKNAFVENLKKNGLTLEQFNEMNRADDMYAHMMQLKVFDPLETYMKAYMKDHPRSPSISADQEGRKVRNAVYSAEQMKLSNEWMQDLRSKALIQRFDDSDALDEKSPSSDGNTTSAKADTVANAKVEVKKVNDFKALLAADPKDFRAVQVIWGQLESAIHSGDVGTVDALLEAGFSPDGDHKGSWDSPLYTATCDHHLAIVDLLLSRGASPSQGAWPTDVYTSGVNLPIDAACWRNYKDIADRLIKAGAVPNPVRYLAGTGDLAGLEALDKKQPLTKEQIHDGLMFATASGHLDAFEWLWAKVGPLDIKAKDNLIGEFYNGAIQNDHLDVLQRLEQLQSSPEKARALALEFALQWNHPDIVTYLLEKGVSPNISLPGGATPLTRAIIAWQNDPLENVRLLLDHGADLNARTKDQYGETALIRAIDSREENVGRLLIERGADVNAVDNEGQTAAWHAAAAHWSFDLLDLLMTKGAKVTGADKKGNAILDMLLRGSPPRLGEFSLSDKAYSEADVENYRVRERQAIERLIASGVDVNGLAGSVTPLMIAIEMSRYDAAQVLIDHGASLETKGYWGRTALAWFFSANIVDRPFAPGALDFLGSILKQGANPNAESLNLNDPKRKMSVLELAIADRFATPADRSTYRTAIQMLLAHGAVFPSTKNESEQVLLQAAAQGDLNKMQNAVAQGASVNAKEADGLTALIISTALGYDASTRWLIGQGADLNASTWDGRTPLLTAVTSQHAELVDLLLAKGAKFSKGGNELDCSIQSGDRQMFETLLKAGAKPGGYSLINCVQYKRADMARTLLDHGANPQPPPMYENKGTVYWAVSEDQPEILKMLLDHGADPVLKTTSGETPLSIAGSREDLKALLEGAIESGKKQKDFQPLITPPSPPFSTHSWDAASPSD